MRSGKVGLVAVRDGRKRKVNCVMFRISFRQIVTDNYVHSTKDLLSYGVKAVQVRNLLIKVEKD